MKSLFEQGKNRLIQVYGIIQFKGDLGQATKGQEQAYSGLWDYYSVSCFTTSTGFGAGAGAGAGAAVITGF